MSLFIPTISNGEISFSSTKPNEVVNVVLLKDVLRIAHFVFCFCSSTFTPLPTSLASGGSSSIISDTVANKWGRPVESFSFSLFSFVLALNFLISTVSFETFFRIFVQFFRNFCRADIHFFQIFYPEIWGFFRFFPCFGKKIVYFIHYFE